MLVACDLSRHKGGTEQLFKSPPVMTFYTCFDNKGSVIARCQTEEEIAVLRRMGRPIAEVKAMKSEEAVVCSLTGSPSDYNEEF